MNLYLISVIGNVNYNLLYHFLRHYETVDMRLSVHDVSSQEEIDKVCGFCNRMGIEPVDRWTGSFTGRAKQNALERLVGGIKGITEDDWVIVADLDEFHIYPEEVHSYFSKLDKKVKTVVSTMIERLPIDGGIRNIKWEIGIWEQFPLEYAITREIRDSCATKVMALRPELVKSLCFGAHYLNYGSWEGVKLVNAVKHFKYIEGFEDRTPNDEWRYEVDRVIEYLKKNKRIVVV